MISHLRTKHPKILVVGDLMIDHYLFGICERISPEAPVQVVQVQKEQDLLGGAGNVVNNLFSFGAKVSVASVIGKDSAGEWIKERLEEKGVNALLVREDRPTTKKSRVIASHQQIVRIDREEVKPIAKESEEQIVEFISQNSFDLILLSDYGKGVLTPALTQQIIAMSNVPVFIDPKGKDYSKYKGADLITPNKKEASEASGIAIKDDTSLQQAGFFLKTNFELKNVVITLSEEGMAIFDEKMHKIPTFAKEVYDVTGAGDTVLGAFGFACASGLSLHEAAHFANLAAGVVVGKVGAATATLDEIEAYEKALGHRGAEDTIKSFNEIAAIVKRAKKSGAKVVFTNGCFDILHLGHVKYLQKAKELGDILIVGLNSDSSVKRLKGKSRPINPQYDRAYILASLEAVDYVVIFDEDTPYELIKKIEPDILVKGADYKDKEVVGSDIAKETILIEFVDGKSTTKIIERIQNND
ncbi:D-beta-D-heptose 7-phosphate kinase / D-beta-D-heptose 1-phosphate adenosyltransferase [Nitratiruptor sp. YY08-26]|nr:MULTISPECIES: D-glycero-beta-D-manno-heptose-7-phosphate kinase [unclassified Nitratiruptor]BCD62725.1 D-beta-D-heptose 7-phosphate kinase / D-beta-D-heptose 1-phosphate adenosyltransferase [Nitratiruptor sp. YY08-13]BCD66661.1 D-beta-D-heptose 7-phosphate kinase / D-beta-D-heptose 1-phosphate adenosyltransferase [Nitratiruptor sp. YY08-26]